MNQLLALTLVTLFSGCFATITLDTPSTSLNPTYTFSDTNTADSYYICLALAPGTTTPTCTTYSTTAFTSGGTVQQLAANTRYVWAIQSLTGAVTEDSAPAYFTTPVIAAPVKTAPTTDAVGVATTATLDWTTSTTDGATNSYCFGTTATCSATSWTDVTAAANTAQNTVPTTVNPTTQYYWQVRACDVTPTCVTATTPVWTYHTTPPAAFDLVSPGAVSTATLRVGISDAPTLSWGASTGANDYAYCFAADDSAACSSYTSIGATGLTFAVSGLSATTKYKWSIQSTDGANSVTATSDTFIFCTTPAGAFSKSTPGDDSSSNAITSQLTWAASDCSSSYRVCIDTAVTSTTACSTWNTGITSLSYTPTLEMGKYYRWQVEANDGTATWTAADSATSVYKFKTIGYFAQTAVTNPTAVKIYPDLVFNWDAITDATITQYEFCLTTSSTCGASDWQVLANTVTSKTYTTLSASTVYYWKVRAQITVGTTAYTVYADGSSTPSTFTTAALPGAFTKTSPRNPSYKVKPSAPALSWGTSTLATSYELCYQVTGAATPSCTTYNTATSPSNPSLDSEKIYSWQVRAIGDGGVTYADASSTSPIWTFTTLPGLTTGCQIP